MPLLQQVYASSGFAMAPSSAHTAPANPSLRSLRRERTRDEIARAALDLIGRKGYDGTLVDEIAHRALISPRTFYRYFPAKEDAFFHGFPAMEASLATTADDGGLYAVLEAAFHAFAESIADHEEEVLPRLPHALSEPALLGQLVHQLYAAETRLAKRLTALLPPGSTRAWQAEVLAAAVTACLLAALRRWHRNPGRAALRTLVDEALTVLEPAIRRLDHA